MPHAAIPFRPHHRFAVPLPRSRRGGLVRLRFLVESRNISFPRRCGGSGERSEPIGAPMPHAALWVVQPYWLSLESSYIRVSMPHAALWVVQLSSSSPKSRKKSTVSMPHAALWVVQHVRRALYQASQHSFNAARGFVGGATDVDFDAKIVFVSFQCRTRLCGWCNRLPTMISIGSWRFQCRTRLCGWCNMQQRIADYGRIPVSMPHAALWVVQHEDSAYATVGNAGFNAARGFVGGATRLQRSNSASLLRFQCRTRLCGWCNRIARSPCPPMGKKPFWKVSGNLRCLTENI